MADLGQEVKNPNWWRQSWIPESQPDLHNPTALKNVRNSSLPVVDTNYTRKFKFPKRSTTKAKYISALEGLVKDERSKRIVVENILQTPKKQPVAKAYNYLRPRKQSYCSARLGNDIEMQVNLQNLDLRGGSYATRFTLPSFKS